MIYSKETAYKLAVASQQAYSDETIVLSRNDTQVAIGETGDDLVIAFRGTENLADVMTDLNCDLINGPGGQVHEGFSLALGYVWQELYSIIMNERQGRELWFTGHSLGGALACLAVAKLRLEKDEPVSGLYTFGQPRTGDREFAKNFNADFKDNTFRFVNNNDIVTRVPFRSMHYSHVGTFKYFDERGNSRDDISWWSKLLDRIHGRMFDLFEPGTDGIKDHAIENYVGNLGKIALAKKNSYQYVKDRI